MRLDKYLANAGIGTRKEVKKIIKSGRITVNEIIIKDFGFKVDFTSSVYIDSQKIAYKQFYYFLLNKPKGYISATYDKYHKVVVDLLPAEYKRFGITPVGRLDLDTTGVMFLTNHGALAHALLSPKNHINKTYLAEVNHPLAVSLLENFKDGIVLDDGYKCLPANLEIIDD